MEIPLADERVEIAASIDGIRARRSQRLAAFDAAVDQTPAKHLDYYVLPGHALAAEAEGTDPAAPTRSDDPAAKELRRRLGTLQAGEVEPRWDRH